MHLQTVTFAMAPRRRPHRAVPGRHNQAGLEHISSSTGSRKTGVFLCVCPWSQPHTDGALPTTQSHWCPAQAMGMGLNDAGCKSYLPQLILVLIHVGFQISSLC